jgi:hypothetical protein
VVVWKAALQNPIPSRDSGGAHLVVGQDAQAGWLWGVASAWRHQGPGEIPGLGRHGRLADRLLKAAHSPPDRVGVTEGSLTAHGDSHEGFAGCALAQQGGLEDRQCAGGVVRVQEGLGETACGAEVPGALAVAVPLASDPAEAPSAGVLAVEQIPQEQGDGLLEGRLITRRSRRAKGGDVDPHVRAKAVDPSLMDDGVLGAGSPNPGPGFGDEGMQALTPDVAGVVFLGPEDLP